tara:strand:+ start:290 stop:1486 length:1197 start_codon:yes stop_codon:yes gene_type:complete
MSLLVSKSVSGLLGDVLLNDGMVKDYHPGDEYTFCFGTAGDPKSIEGLLQLHDISVPRAIPEEYLKSFEECGYEGDIPWSCVIPGPAYRSLVKQFLGDLQEALEVINSSSYSLFFSGSNSLFNMLRPARIDKSLCEVFLREGDNHVLKSILKMSDSNGFIPVPTYNRVSTKTGRLVVKQGPQILTMKKEHRAVLRPSDPDKRLYEIDFTSLEPRVALNIASRECSSDVYTSFAKDSGLNVTRDVAKLAILCSLYGAGKYRLESVLRKDDSKVTASVLISAVRKYFAVDNLSKALVEQASDGFITNYFARPIVVDESRSAVLVNNFLQSTASDIAICGFLDFCQVMKDLVRPLFVIHDALVFEASPKHLDRITKYVDNGYESDLLGNFPLKITEFDSHE